MNMLFKTSTTPRINFEKVSQSDWFYENDPSNYE